MKKLASLFLVTSITLNLVACSGVSNQNMGTAGGAIIGGLLGSQFGQGSGAVAATIGGAIIGGYIGGTVGKSMDDTDRSKVNTILERNPTNQASTWQNPDTGYTYTVKPEKTYRQDNGQPCREYITSALIGNKKQQVYGTACRQADGSWKTQ
ncbi:MAG: hypothetical protein LEGION0398_MBIBDBAK_00036 [Legionellaceae bacterium]